MGLQTPSNVMTAFVAESAARNRYTYFASQAKKDGYVLVSNIFTETANQEKEHAERLWNFFMSFESNELAGNVAVLPINDKFEFPATSTLTTNLNLIESIKGEVYEHEIMYPNYAEIADKEGYDVIAEAMQAIAMSEAFHARRFTILHERLEAGIMFERPIPVIWRCLNCGYVYSESKALDPCPACLHPKAYAEVLNEGFPIK